MSKVPEGIFDLGTPDLGVGGPGGGQDFTGSWVQAGCEGFDKFLIARGIPEDKIKMATSLKFRAVITQTGNKLEITNSGGPITEVKTIDVGSRLTYKTPRGETMSALSTWDGDVIVTTATPNGDERRNIYLRRWIDPGTGYMIVQITYRGVTMTRSFRRA